MRGRVIAQLFYKEEEVVMFDSYLKCCLLSPANAIATFFAEPSYTIKQLNYELKITITHRNRERII